MQQSSEQSIARWKQNLYTDKNVSSNSNKIRDQRTKTLIDNKEKIKVLTNLEPPCIR